MRLDHINSKHFQTALNFANDVVSGKKLANKEQRQACQRFLDDLERDDLDFKQHQFDFAIEFIQTFIFPEKGESSEGGVITNKPIKLMDWQIFVIVNLFGFFVKGKNVRRFQEVLLFLPRKSAKTATASFISLVKSLIDSTSGATTYIVGNGLKQAKVSFDFLVHNMKLKHNLDQFKPRIRDNNQEHSIMFPMGTQSISINAIGSDEKYLDGLLANCIIADELHTWKRPKRYSLMKDAMKAFSGSRMLLAISTAGDQIDGFLDQRVQLLKKVLDGTIEDKDVYDRYFIYLCTAERDNKGRLLNPITNKPTEMDDPELIESVNPSANQIVPLANLVNDAKIAMDSDDGTRNEFLNKTLNVFTTSSEAYFDVDEFKYSDSLYDWSLDELASKKITWYGFADLSVLHDLSAAGIYGNYTFKDKDDNKKSIDIVIPHAFFPRKLAIEKADKEAIPLFEWESEGWATLSNTDVVQQSDIAGWFIDMRKKGFKIKSVHFDKRASSEFALIMKSEKFKLADASQLPSIKTQGLRRIENKAKNEELYYLHRKSYEYCLSNVKAEELYNGWMRYKKITQNMRIDLFDASVFGAVALEEDLIEQQKRSQWGF